MTKKELLRHFQSSYFWQPMVDRRVPHSRGIFRCKYCNAIFAQKVENIFSKKEIKKAKNYDWLKEVHIEVAVKNSKNLLGAHIENRKSYVWVRNKVLGKFRFFNMLRKTWA